MTLRFRGTAFDTLRRQRLGSHDARTVQRPDPRRRRQRHLPCPYADASTPRAPPRISHRPRAHRPAGRLPSPTDRRAPRSDPPSHSLLSETVALLRGPEGEFRYSRQTTRGLRYEAFVASDARCHRREARRRPSARATWPSRSACRRASRTLAHKWTDRSPPQARRPAPSRSHLRHGVPLRHGLALGRNQAAPVDDFLFESKRGHCEFFSTAMALMLRAVGIPSRNVTGFVGGTYNRFGQYYAVRQGDAHSWVEAYIADSARPGWVTFDPTPPAGAQPLERDEPASSSTCATSSRRSRSAGAPTSSATTFARRSGSSRMSTRNTKPFAPRPERTTASSSAGLAQPARGRPPCPPLPRGLCMASAATAQALDRSQAGRLASRREGAGRDVALPGARRRPDRPGNQPTAVAPASPSRTRPHAARHPLAPEVLALTHVYLESRFGHHTDRAGGSGRSSAASATFGSDHRSTEAGAAPGARGRRRGRAGRGALLVERLARNASERAPSASTSTVVPGG